MFSESAYLHELVANFRSWLADNYSTEEINQGTTDDPGYPRWKKVEDYFAVLLTEKRLAALSREAQVDLLYLIARNWDTGTMIAWLSTGPNLSNCGPLSSADFLRLGHTLTTLTHSEFRAAKSQFAAACRKFPTLTQEVEQLLLALFADPDEYVRTCALDALGTLHHPDLARFVAEAWETSIDEHSKMAYLNVVRRHLPGNGLTQHYIDLAVADPGPYLADYVTRIREEGPY
jgi:hypothetical protein